MFRQTLPAAAVLLAATSAAPADILMVPAAIDLGVVRPATTRAASIWIVNDGTESREIVAVRGGCGCMQMTAFAPRTLAPGESVEVPFTIESAHLPVGTAPALCVYGHDGMVASAPVRIVADDAAPASRDEDRRSAVGRPTWVPTSIDLGAVAVGGDGSTEAWIMNPTERTLRVASIKAGCGCTTVSGLESGAEIAPGGALRVAVSMRAPGTERIKSTTVRVAFETGDPVEVPVSMRAVHPLVARVEAFCAARAAADTAALAALLADDSRVWYGSRDGDGVRRTIDGRGAWSDWDREMFATVETDEFVVNGRTVSAYVRESNDYYRLLERAPSQLRVSYTFDADDRIAETLVEGRSSTVEDRLESFLAWAGAHHADELAVIRPGGRIAPSAENAKRWKALLRAWRQSEDGDRHAAR